MARKQRIGRPRDADSAQTRTRILDGARHLFASRGYEATSNRLIAEEAGLTTGAIYHYFDRKLDIYVAVHDETQRRVYDRFDQAVVGHDTFVGCLRAVLEAAHDLNDEDPSLASFLGSCRVDAARDPVIGAAIAANGLSRRAVFFTALIELGVETGEIAEEERTTAMSVIQTILVGLVDGVSDDSGRHRIAIDGVQRLVEGRLIRPPRPAPLRSATRRGRAKAG